MVDKEYRVLHKIKVKKKLIEELGGKCKICSEEDPIVLQFDHIQDDGYKDKKNKNGINVRQNRTIYYYYKIFNQDKKIFFAKFQLLCANCNFRKEYLRRKNL